MAEKKKEVRKMFTTRLPPSLTKKVKLDALNRDMELQDWVEEAFENNLKRTVK